MAKFLAVIVFESDEPNAAKKFGTAVDKVLKEAIDYPAAGVLPHTNHVEEYTDPEKAGKLVAETIREMSEEVAKAKKRNR